MNLNPAVGVEHETRYLVVGQPDGSQVVGIKWMQCTCKQVMQTVSQMRRSNEDEMLSLFQERPRQRLRILNHYENC